MVWVSENCTLVETDDVLMEVCAGETSTVVDDGFFWQFLMKENVFFDSGHVLKRI